MTFGQNFIDNLMHAHMTGEISSDLSDAMADDMVWTSLAKSSMGNQSRGKAEWLDFISRDRQEYTSSVVYENDEIVIWKGAGNLNGAPQVFLFCMELENGTIKNVQHVRGPAA